MAGDADLFEVIRALGPRRRFANPLDCRQQEPDQNRDDGDDDQQFDERETGAGSHGISTRGGWRPPLSHMEREKRT